MWMRRAWSGVALWCASAAACAQLLAAGDVTPDGAVLWTRTDAPGSYEIEVALDASFAKIVRRAKLNSAENLGLTAQIAVDGLASATRHHYRLRGPGGPLPNVAQFVTAPANDAGVRVRLLVGADLGGQGYGRIRPGTPLGLDGFPIFAAMSAEQADAFIALGDMLYSDRPVTARAPDPGQQKDNDFQIPKPGPGYVSNLEDFRRDWHYHRSDHRYDAFLRRTPIFATWDDHELVNDSGGPELLRGPSSEDLERDPQLRQSDPSRPRNAQKRREDVFHNPVLFQAGRQTMFEYNPIRVLTDAPGGFERRLWRSFRWGRHVEVFMLDTRSYRDPRYRFDTEQAPKTMLGSAQKQWLKERLASSDATWKFVVSSVPLSIAGGNARDPQKRIYRDGWANGGDANPYGYERELSEIVGFLRQRAVRNVVFLTGDQHFSNVIAYDPDGDGTIDFHELNMGPLRAGPSAGRAPDTTFSPKVIFSDRGQASFAYGWIEISESGALTAEIRRVDGATASGSRLELPPR